MGILLGLVSAFCYGVSDFVGGVGGRRSSAVAVAIISQPFGLLAALVAVAVLDSRSPSASTLLWGAASGVGSGIGTLALYHGLAVARMSVVAPLSGVLAAAIPAVVGIAGGENVSPLRLTGLALALPGIALVSLQPSDPDRTTSSGVVEGVVAGLGFALLFIGLARAGTSSGAWPLVPAQAIAVLTIVVAGPVIGRPRGTWRAAWWPGVVTGVLAGAANLAFLAATGRGQLSVVAVLTSLYPAVTILLAHLLLHEHWLRVQIAGLVLSGVAVALISLG